MNVHLADELQINKMCILDCTARHQPSLYKTILYLKIVVLGLLKKIYDIKAKLLVPNTLALCTTLPFYDDSTQQ